MNSAKSSMGSLSSKLEERRKKIVELKNSINLDKNFDTPKPKETKDAVQD